MNLKQQKALYAAVAMTFQLHPEEKVLHVTPDGNCFLEKNKNAADLHAKRTNSEVIAITREEFEGAQTKMDSMTDEEKEAAEKAAEAAEKAREEAEKAKSEAKKKAEEDAKALEEAEEKERAEAEAKKAAEAAAKAEEEGREAATGKGSGMKK